MDTLRYYLDNVIDFFSYSRPHSVVTWVPIGLCLVFAIMYMLMGYFSVALIIVGLILLVWFIRYDDFSLIERIIAIVLTILLFGVSAFVFSQNEMSSAQTYDTIITIRQLPGEVTAESAGDIQAARAQYDGLSDEQKLQVTNYDYLLQKEAELAELGRQEASDAEVQKKREEYQAAVEMAHRKAEAAKSESSSAASPKTPEEANELARIEAEKQAEKAAKLKSQVSALNKWYAETYLNESPLASKLSIVKRFEVDGTYIYVHLSGTDMKNEGTNGDEMLEWINIALWEYPGELDADNWNGDTDIELDGRDLNVSSN